MNEREALLKAYNFIIYNKGGINRLMFDVLLSSQGTQAIEFGNSSLWFLYNSAGIESFSMKVNPKYSQGGYAEPVLRTVGNRFLGIQFFCESGGTVISNTHEKLLTIYANVFVPSMINVQWDILNTAIVDRYLPHRVITACEGSYTYPGINNEEIENA